MMIKHAITPIIATLLATGGSCGDEVTPVQPVPNTRPPQHIYVPEDYDTPFDARSGDTITVILYPDRDPVERCHDMGGEPIYNPYTTIWTCDDVDF